MSYFYAHAIEIWDQESRRGWFEANRPIIDEYRHMSQSQLLSKHIKAVVGSYSIGSNREFPRWLFSVELDMSSHVHKNIITSECVIAGLVRCGISTKHRSSHIRAEKNGRILQTHFQHFPESKNVFCQQFVEKYSHGSNQQWSSIRSGNGSAPIRRQAIIRNNDGIAYSRIPESLDLTVKNLTKLVHVTHFRWRIKLKYPERLRSVWE